MTSAIKIVLAAILFLIALRYYYIPKPHPGIPYSRMSYLYPFGDLFHLGYFYNFTSTGEVFRWFNTMSLYHKSGIFQLFLPSFSTTFAVVCVTDPVEAKHIVTMRSTTIDRAGKLLSDLFRLMCPKASLGKYSPTSDFKVQRYLWNGMISPEFLNNVVGPRTRDSVVKLAEMWTLRHKNGDQPPSPAMAEIKVTFFETIVSVLLGKRLGVLDADVAQQKSPAAKVGKQALDSRRWYKHWTLAGVCMEWVVTGVSPGAYAWFFSHLFRPFMNAQRVIESRLQAIIDSERRKAQAHDNDKSNTSAPKNALELVLRRAAAQSRAEEAVSDMFLMNELVELLIVGHDTLTSSLGWGLKYLADHPAVQERLYTDLLRCIPSAAANVTPTSAQILAAHVPYLEAFISETLRLSCVGPISFREARTDCVIGGFHIPAGTPIVIMTQDVTHRGMHSVSGAAPASLGGRADDPPMSVFYPERWMDAARETYNPDALHSIPFSAGARGCFGKKIALVELPIMLTVLLWNFRFEKLGAKFSRYEATDGLTRRPDCCYVSPVPRVQEMVVPEEVMAGVLPLLEEDLVE